MSLYSGKQQIWLVIVYLAGLLTACQTMRLASSPVFNPQNCPMATPAGYNFRCGTVTVPEDRNSENERQVTLSIVVVEASAQPSKLSPVIFLDGGPGGATLAGLPERLKLFQDIIAERPVIFFDQRGVGFSRPALDCIQLEEAQIENFQEVLPVQEESQRISDSYAACKTLLEQNGISLAAYTTAASADDVRDIVAALGYPEVTLMGVSYGTRLAQVTIQRHQSEGWIRGAVLDSVVPLQVEELQEFWPNTQAIFEQTFARCAADPDCAGYYPDLQATFYTTMQQLHASPLEMSVFHPRTGKRISVKLDEKDFFSLLFVLLYDPHITTQIPQIIIQVQQGKANLMQDPFQYFLSIPQFIFEGMNQSVQCSEEGIQLDLHAIQTANASLHPVFQQLAQGYAEQAQADCQVWGVKAADPAENKTLKTKLPVLILSGAQDPITPPAWGKLLQASIPTAYFYEFPGAAHSVLSTTGNVNICATKLVLDFLHDSAQPPDSSCLTKLEPLKFAVP